MACFCFKIASMISAASQPGIKSRHFPANERLQQFPKCNVAESDLETHQV